MAKDSRELALALIASRSSGIRGRMELLLLPSLVSAISLISSTPVVLVTIACVVEVVAFVVSEVRGNRSGDNRRVLRLELGFMIDQLFMKFSNRRSRVAAFDLINERLVVLWKSFQYRINLIFRVLWFPKKSKLVKDCRKSLNVLIDRLSSFRRSLELLLELFEVTTTWLGVCCSESAPDLSRGGRGGENRLDSCRDSTKKSAVYQPVLSLPDLILWIGNNTSIVCDRRRWYNK